jgi:hypothetical protein
MDEKKKRKMLDIRLIEEEVEEEKELEIEKYEFYTGFYLPYWIEEEKLIEIIKSSGFDEKYILLWNIHSGYIIIIGKVMEESDETIFKTSIYMLFERLFDYVKNKNLLREFVLESPYFKNLYRVISSITDAFGVPDEKIIAKIADGILKDLIPYEDFMSDKTRELIAKLLQAKTAEEFKEAFLNYWDSYSLEIQKIIFKSLFQMSREVLFINALTRSKTLNVAGIKYVKLYGEINLNLVNLYLEGRRYLVYFSSNGDKKFIVFNQGRDYIVPPMIFFFIVVWDNAIIELVDKVLMIVSNSFENTEMEIKKSALSFANALDKMSIEELEKFVKVLEEVYNLQFENYFDMVKQQRVLLQRFIFNYKFRINRELRNLMGGSIRSDIREMMADKKAVETLNNLNEINNKITKLSLFYQELNEKIKQLIEAKKNKRKEAILLIWDSIRNVIFKFFLP